MSSDQQTSSSQVRTGHRIADWLSFHQLQSAMIQDVISATRARVLPVGPSKRSDWKSNLKTKVSLGSQQDCFRSYVIPALVDGFNCASEIEHILNSVDFIGCAETQVRTPHTIDQGRGMPPRVALDWRGSVEDLICLAHEAGHALQILWSDHAVTPPIARETCAFLAEIALLSYAETQEPHLHSPLAQVWHQENATYFGADTTTLLEALADPSAPCDYRHNYPLARLAARRLAEAGGLAACAPLFAQGAAAMETVRAALTQTNAGTEAVWTQVQDRFVEVFPHAATEMKAAVDNMIVDLSPDVRTMVVSRGPLPPVVRCGGRGMPEDFADTAGALAEALALPYRAGAPEAPVSAALGRATISGTWSEPEPLVGHCLCGLSPAALYEVMTGRVEVAWLSRPGKIAVVARDGTVHAPEITHAPLWIRWRSLGVLALAALARGGKVQTGRADDTHNALPKDFIRATGDRVDTAALTAKPLAPAPDAATALGLMLHHLSVSHYHRQFSLRRYLPIEVLPPLLVGQFQAFVSPEGHPLGCVTWAWVSDALEARLHATGDALSADQWNHGPRLFFNDWITERAGTRPIVTHMTKLVFPDEIATSLRRNPDGSVRRINRWTGIRQRAPLITAPRPCSNIDTATSSGPRTCAAAILTAGGTDEAARLAERS